MFMLFFLDLVTLRVIHHLLTYDHSKLRKCGPLSHSFCQYGKFSIDLVHAQDEF